MLLKKMVRAAWKLAFALVVLSAAPAAAFAESASPDFSYEINDNVVTITRYTGSATDLVIPSEIEGRPVTAIGDSAFRSCTSLKTITVPSSVELIGNDAFFGCSSLVSASIPDSVRHMLARAFAGCASLKSVSIPSSMGVLSDYVFADCSSLSEITIPSSITKIQTGAFQGCTSLKSVSIPSTVTFIEKGVFSGCTSLSAISVDDGNPSFSSDEQGVLYDKAKTTLVAAPGAAVEIEIPEGVASIGGRAFDGCALLSSVSISSSVTSIGNQAFSKCSSLKSIKLPSSVTSLGDGAFMHCRSLALIELPSTVTSIGGTCFHELASPSVVSVDTQGQYDLLNRNPLYISTDRTTVVLAEKVSGDFKYTIGNGGAATITGYTGSESHLNIPSQIDGYSVGAIGENAFYRNFGLVSVTIPSSVSSIGPNAFGFCESLASASIPEGVVSVGAHAFSGCLSLREVTIPSSVEQMGDNPFYRCSSLKSIAVDAANAAYCSDSQGILYDKDKTELVAAPGAIESAVIPSTVTAIGNQAFSGCFRLEEVVIADGVHSIGASCFAECGDLARVILPSTVTSIGHSAFFYLPQGSVVAVKTQEQYDLINGNAGYISPDRTTVVVGDDASVPKRYRISILSGSDSGASCTLLNSGEEVKTDEYGHAYVEAGAQLTLDTKPGADGTAFAWMAVVKQANYEFIAESYGAAPIEFTMPDYDIFLDYRLAAPGDLFAVGAGSHSHGINTLFGTRPFVTEWGEEAMGAEAGQQLTVRFAPAAGYRLESASLVYDVFGTYHYMPLEVSGNEASFEMLPFNGSFVEADYVRIDGRYEVSAYAYANGGKVRPETEDGTECYFFQPGETVYLSAACDYGFEIDAWYVTDEDNSAVDFEITADGRCAFTMPGKDVHVNADFAPANGGIEIWTNESVTNGLKFLPNGDVDNENTVGANGAAFGEVVYRDENGERIAGQKAGGTVIVDVTPDANHALDAVVYAKPSLEDPDMDTRVILRPAEGENRVELVMPEGVSGLVVNVYYKRTDDLFDITTSSMEAKQDDYDVVFTNAAGREIAAAKPGETVVMEFLPTSDFVLNYVYGPRWEDEPEKISATKYRFTMPESGPLGVTLGLARIPVDFEIDESVVIPESAEEAGRIVGITTYGALVSGKVPNGMSKEDAAALKEALDRPGGKVYFSVTVSASGMELEGGDLDAIKAQLEAGESVVFASDLSVSVVVSADNQSGKAKAVLSETGKAIPFWLAVEDAEGKFVRVVRIHGGAVEEVPVSGRGDHGVLVEADRFSTYTGIVSDTTTVAFEANGGSAVEVREVAYGEALTEPAAPVKAGWLFAGWYADEALTEPYDFGEPVTTHIGTLYAKWVAPNTPNTSVPEKIEVPISGDEETIHVGASVSGDKATIDNVDLSHLEAVIGDDVETGTVTIDFSTLGVELTSVEIPAEAVKQISAAVADPTNDAESLEIVFSDGISIEFDAVALSKKASQAGGADIAISILPSERAKPNKKQEDSVNGRPFYDITVSSGGERISDMGGRITIHAPYELKPGEHARGITVWYVDEDGNREKCETIYDSASGRVSWKTDHLSIYMIGYDEEAAKCSGGEGCPSAKFSDSVAGAWYHSPVDWSIERGILRGYDGTDQIGPNDGVTREQLVVMLHRWAQDLGMNVAVSNGAGLSPYEDAEAVSSWSEESMIWATNAGIITGHGGTRLAPQQVTTREQMAVILMRFAKFAGADTSASAALDTWPDAAGISDWAVGSMRWACNSGVITGKVTADGALLAPDEGGTRAQAATMLMRLEALL